MLCCRLDSTYFWLLPENDEENKIICEHTDLPCWGKGFALPVEHFEPLSYWLSTEFGIELNLSTVEENV